ncbi:DNA-binding transcriptional activator of the SARP family [Ornithinimicrobium cerasi]|uniref:DNA-binding transcriptional activator of the SARP family n=2 Tax=Ornithinimicrobium cerasi TaxID=2248773 RepID=A0A285VUE3_9MICO|nr:DNA-binding transcriptional activator of the SARP family [Ornithinimicrobium cerasi]
MLGELLVSVGDRPVAIAGRQQRLLLMSLALRANQVASPERLIDALWGPTPPASAAAGLRVSVSKLRRVLASAGAADVLVTRPGGYVLLLEAGRTDLARFEELVAQARATDDHVEREAMLAKALSLWRGPALEGLDHDLVAVAELIRLQELRSLAAEDRVECELALGRHREVVPTLEALITEDPFREGRQGQLMRALNGSGRQSEALDSYRRFRQRLVDETGLEPGAKLRALEQAILLQEEPNDQPAVPPGDRPATGKGEQPRTRRPWLVTAAIAVCVAVATAVAAMGWWWPEEPQVRADFGTVARLDPDTGAVLGHVDVIARVGVGDGFGDIVVGDDVWVLNSIDHTVSRIDIEDASVSATVAVGADPVGLALAGGDLWVTSAAENEVVRVDGLTGDVVSRIPVGDLPSGITEADGDIWVANHRGLPTGSVWRIDAVTNQVLAKIPVGARDYRRGPQWISSGAGSVWVGVPNLNAVVRIDARSNKVVGTIPVADGGVCGPVTAGDAAVWVAGGFCGNGSLTRIDPATNTVVASITSSRWHTVFGAVPGFGSLWVNTDRGPFQLEPDTHAVVGRLAVPGDTSFGGNLTVDAESLWIHDAGSQSVLRLTGRQ